MAKKYCCSFPDQSELIVNEHKKGEHMRILEKRKLGAFVFSVFLPLFKKFPKKRISNS